MYAGGVLASSLTALGARLLHDRGVAIHYVVLGRAMLGMIFVCVGLYAYRGGVPNPLGERRAVLCLRSVGLGLSTNTAIGLQYINNHIGIMIIIIVSWMIDLPSRKRDR